MTNEAVRYMPVVTNETVRYGPVVTNEAYGVWNGDQV